MSGSQPAGGGSGFYTGPYNTGPQSGNAQVAGSPGGPQAGGYAGAANTTANPGGSAYNGYQSPYNNPAGGYRTADNRSTYGMTSGATPTSPYSGSAAPQPWNSAGNNAMGSGPVAPAGYGVPPTAPSQPAFGPGGSSPTAQPSWNTSAPANSGYSAPAAGYSSPTNGTGSAGLSPLSGGYRPGSISRNVAPLGGAATGSPASSYPTAGQATYPASTGAYSTAANPYSSSMNTYSGGSGAVPASSYPTSNYSGSAAGSYPSAPSNTTAPYGNYSYPTTGQ